MIKELILNVESGEIELIEFSKTEADKLKKASLENELFLQSEAEAKAAARQSALEKLAALGLTEAEIQALAG